MADSLMIVPEPPANKGLDYAYLKEEGTRLVQELSGKIWSDYNESDPGVTTLEQLCYALTELSYRAEFPLKDLLIDKRAGRIRTRRQALFIPRRIYPCNPLTEDDYRKLIVDRVDGVENVWLTHYGSRVPSKTVNGLYDFWVYAPGVNPVCEPEDAKRLCKRVRRVYCRYRDLCEDLHRVHILDPLKTVVQAEVTVDNTRTVDAILAGIFFNLGNLIAPELRREPLKRLVDEGKSPDEIFNGPLLRNGFIDNAQLQPKASEIPVQEFVSVIARSPGVVSVRKVKVRVAGHDLAFSGNQSVPVEMKNILELDTSPGPSGGFTIRLFKNGVECKPKPDKVQSELERLWAEYRRTYRLLPQYREYFSIPEGRDRDVQRYYSVQNQYPGVYGISSFGLPDDATEPRKAQAKQLKGYLMAFDQLMADFFAQLARVKDLYSIDPRLTNTYFYQYLYESVPDVRPLIDDDYAEGLPAIVASEDPFTGRRNRFLDFLLALYAEKLDASSLTETSCESNQPAGDGADLMAAKLALLQRLVRSTQDRGRAFDYLAEPLPRNIAGMEIKSRIQLGLSVREQRPLSDLLDELELEIVEADAAASIGRPAGRVAEHIEGEFPSVASLVQKLGGLDDQSEDRTAALRGQRVTEGFLRAAADPRNLRAGVLPGETAVTLVCRTCDSGDESKWRLVGKYPDLESAVATARRLAEIAALLTRYSRQLYVVEHTLLRFGRSRDRDEPEARPEEPDGRARGQSAAHTEFVYSFTVTAVVSTALATEIGSEYQTVVKQIIRENVPSHIVSELCFLRPVQMRSFEALYWEWREALREQVPRRIVITSARLRRFLQRCERRRPGSLDAETDDDQVAS